MESKMVKKLPSKQSVQRNHDSRELVIQELSSSFLAPTKGANSSKYLQDTGTLLTKGSFFNLAKCNVSTKGFTAGKTYQCGCISGDSLQAVNDFGDVILLKLTDVDFEFILNRLNK